MRATIQWLALAPLLVTISCRTAPQSPSSADSGVALSGTDVRFGDALAHYSQALISENTLGDYQAGILHIRAAAASDPANLPLALKVAVDDIARKDYTGAVAVLRQAARFHPASADVHLLLGTVSQAQGHSDEAARAFRSAIQNDPDRPDGYVRLATLHVIRLNPKKALNVVDAGLSRMKDPAALLDFCQSVGRIYLAGKDVSGAIRFLEPVFAYGAGHEEACEMLGQCYLASGRHREAARVYQVLLKRKPDSSQYALLLGEAYEQGKDYVHAQESYRLAGRGVPPDAMASLRLANLEMMVNPGKGLATLEEAVKSFPDDLRIHVFLALSYMRLDRYEEAVRQFDWIAGEINRNAFVAKTVQPLFYFWYGQACDRAGHAEDSERHIEHYLAVNPNSGEALNYLAYMWAEQSRNLDRALDYVVRALKIEPDNGAYLDTQGWIYFKKGEYHRALELLSRALKKEDDSPAIMEHVGDVWYALNKRDKAVAYWLKSLRVDPLNKGLRDKLTRENVAADRLPPAPNKDLSRTAGRFPL